MIDLYVDPGHASEVEDGSQAHPFKTIQASYAIDAGAYIDVEGTRTLTDDTTVHCYRTGEASQSQLGETGDVAVDFGGYTFTVINESAEPYYLVLVTGGFAPNRWRSPAVTRWVGIHIEDTRLVEFNSVEIGYNLNRWGGLTVEFDSCRFTGGGTDNFAYVNDAVTAVFNNCIFEGRWLYDSETWTGGVGNMLQARRGAIHLNNCSVVNFTATGVRLDHGTIVIRNSYIGTDGDGSCFTSSAITPTVTTSAISDESSAVSGITQNVSQASCNFESLTLGAADIATTSGSALHDAGTNIGPTGTEVVAYTDDHYGTERGSDWDIGAYEFDELGLPRLVYGASGA